MHCGLTGSRELYKDPGSTVFYIFSIFLQIQQSCGGFLEDGGLKSWQWWTPVYLLISPIVVLDDDGSLRLFGLHLVVLFALLQPLQLPLALLPPLVAPVRLLDDLRGQEELPLLPL